MKAFYMTILFSLMALFALPQKKMFVRIIDLNGNEVAKGHILKTSDSTITTTWRERIHETPVTDIGHIKTKRSFGHTVLITTLITTGTSASLGAILGSSPGVRGPWDIADTYAQGAAIGAIVYGLAGMGGGAMAGTIIAGTKNRPVFIVNGSKEVWMKIKDLLNAHQMIRKK